MAARIRRCFADPKKKGPIFSKEKESHLPKHEFSRGNVSFILVPWWVVGVVFFVKSQSFLVQFGAMASGFGVDLFAGGFATPSEAQGEFNLKESR